MTPLRPAPQDQGARPTIAANDPRSQVNGNVGEWMMTGASLRCSGPQTRLLQDGAREVLLAASDAPRIPRTSPH